MMQKIDDNMLAQLGLGSLPADERKKLIDQITETLELRVGMKLAENMSDDQLDEFERFVDGDIEFAKAYLDNLDPNWDQDANFQAQKTAAIEAGVSEQAITAEYAAYKWLETNFPTYKQVVSEEFEKLKNEIKRDASKIQEIADDPTTAA
jgi:hypothetical protein